MKKFASSILPLLDRRQARPEIHPDADLLAAFAERKLSRAERTNVLAHLAECPNCRDVLSFAAAANPHEATSVSAARNPRAAWWQGRLAAIAAAMFFVIATGWHFALLKRGPATAQAVKFRQMTPSKRRPAASAPPLTVEKETTHTAAASKQRVSSRRGRTSVPAPSAVPLLAQADAPDESRDTLILTAPQRQLALPVGSSENSVPQREVPRYALQSNSMFSSETAAARSRALLPALHAIEESVWSLEAASGPGAVRKSDDGGKTWRNIAIDGETRFYALSAAGSDIWAGGAGGRLFHSPDDGVHWTRVPVIDGNIPLWQPIVQIDIRGGTITLKTSSGAMFVSNNAGLNWRRP